MNLGPILEYYIFIFYSKIQNSSQDFKIFLSVKSSDNLLKLIYIVNNKKWAPILLINGVFGTKIVVKLYIPYLYIFWTSFE